MQRASAIIKRIVLICIALILFLHALKFLRNGLDSFGHMLNGSFLLDSLASTLGFGWILAMLIMSGSPVAILSLTMLQENVISLAESLTMITGSRIGVSVFVLGVSLVYTWRSKSTKERRQSARCIGTLAVLLTSIVYIPGMFIGLFLLQKPAFTSNIPPPPPVVLDLINTITAPATTWGKENLPPSIMALIGFAALMASLRLFDYAIPDVLSEAKEELEGRKDWRSRKWLIFGLGSLVSLITMSVSVSLTLLVPLVAKGCLKREHTLPYIMGANIMTLGDTLVAAYLLGQAPAQVVFAELIGITIVTLAIMIFIYDIFAKVVGEASYWLTGSKMRLGALFGVMVLIPWILVLWK